MDNTAYFPPLYGKVDCTQCEAAHCWCRGKYQRDRLDFTYTSGRCPRLPDKRGFVEESERALYAQTFPLVHAERAEDIVHLTLTIPGAKRPKKVYHTRSGYWYFREKDSSGAYVKRGLSFQFYNNPEEIIRDMERLRAEYCVFRATIEDYYL